MSKETGGPAFPTECCNTGIYNIPGFAADNIPANSTAQYQGMTLRDHFAGLAMQSLMVDSHLDRTQPYNQKNITTLSYQMADAMLEERNKP